MAKPRLLLVASFTELEWGIRAQLEQWAEVAAFDLPGVGEERLPEGFGFDADGGAEWLSRWRKAGAERGRREADERGWDRFVVVGDSLGGPTAVRLAEADPARIAGLALGHAALSHSTAGARAPMRGGVWDALIQLARQGNDPLVRHGIAQMTRGGVSDELAERMIERFPDMELVIGTLEALGDDPEPIGDELAALADAGVPMLFAKHEGCLGHTDEGFEDVAATFPQASTAICPETCSSSPAFADALRDFCGRLEFESLDSG